MQKALCKSHRAGQRFPLRRPGLYASDGTLFVTKIATKEIFARPETSIHQGRKSSGIRIIGVIDGLKPHALSLAFPTSHFEIVFKEPCIAGSKKHSRKSLPGKELREAFLTKV
jgi:hypothetical protein